MAHPSDTNLYSAKNRVQQFNKFIELLGASGLKILTLLSAGNTASIVAKTIPCQKSNVTYWTKKLIRLGMLRLQTKDVIKIYQLTPFGSKVLTASDVRCDLEAVVLEDFGVKFEVLEGEKGVIAWEKLGEPRNWVKLGVRIGCIRVVKTSRSIIIHPGQLSGFDVDELEVEAGRIVERVRGVLESRFGMVLSEEGVPLHKPVYRVYSEEAKEDVKHGTAILEGPEGRLSATDNSPPGPPHEEFDGKERAIARQRLPDSVRSLERKVDELRAVVVGLVEALKPMDQLTGALQKLLNPELVPEAGPDSVQQKMERYVT